MPSALRPALETLRNDKTGETLGVVSVTPDLLCFEFRLAPGAAIPGAHMHPRSEQRVAVTEGELHLRIGGRHVVAGPGESRTVPAGVSHIQWNPGRVAVRALEEYRPAGRLYEMFSTFFQLAGDGMLTRRGRVASPLLVAAFFAEFRDEVRAAPVVFQWGLDLMGPIARRLGYHRHVARCLAGHVAT